MSAPEYPDWRLRPKKSASRFRHGDPWVFADELVLDRRSRAVAPGAIVRLVDHDKRPFALAAANSGSRIAARILDLDCNAVIDTGWLKARLTRALALRETLYGQPYYRLVHAEGDGLPGLIVDRFGDVLALQPNAAWTEAFLDEIVEAVASVTGTPSVWINRSGRAREAEGLSGASAWARGGVEGPVAVPMNGAVYLADITGGQKTGLYFDQRDNQKFAARLARGGAMLDVFSHVGGFGLAALAGGANHATAIDSSAPALALAREGAARMGMSDRFATETGDAVRSMRAMGEAGRSYELVVCDPPAFAPNKAALQAGLRGYEKVAHAAAPLVARDGYLVLCSCSHAADLARFLQASLRGVGRAGRRAQVLHVGQAGPDHPVHARLAETAYLKAVFLRLD